MKSKWFAILSLTIILTQAHSQSSTIEINPEFHYADSTYVSETYKVDLLESLDFVGISCFHTTEIQATISSRILIDGKWSDWDNFGPAHEHADAKRKAYEGAPILESFQSIQFKSTQDIEALTARLFVAKSNEIETLPLRSSSCEIPVFCDRSCWCTSCPIDPTPEFTIPGHIILHHSAGFNESNNFAAVVEYYYDLHVNTNGWDDIGYNWLIDANGIIYQGRPDDYQGAHFSCINEKTVGICMIGEFTSRLPTVAAIDALISLAAYEATENTIDVTSEIYHETGALTLRSISGHRDGNNSPNGCSSTICPGDSFYAYISTVISKVNETPCYIEGITANSHILESTVSCYPNPFSNELYIKNGSQGSSYKLIDISGNTIQRLSSNSVNDLSQLPKGTYRLTVGGKYVDTVVKQ